MLSRRRRFIRLVIVRTRYVDTVLTSLLLGFTAGIIGGAFLTLHVFRLFIS